MDENTPCKSCPYRVDAQVGYWHKEEFEKILESERSQIVMVISK